jgi:hypothetical protein
MFDPSKFPRLAHYLAKLPRGLDSYPECQAKGAVLRNWLQDAQSLAGSPLPDELLGYLTSPPSQSAWLPEVHLWAVVLAEVDAAAMSEARFMEWCRELNLRLLKGPVYRFVLVMLSPETILGLGASTFRGFHRGFGITVGKSAGAERGLLFVQLDFPPHLIDELCLKGLGTAFEVALALGRARAARVTLVEAKATSACFAAEWDAR